MWGGLKTDLLDFVSTLQGDTVQALSAVITHNETNPNNNNNNNNSIIKKSKEQALIDLKHSYNTYSLNIEIKYQKYFSKFLSKFTMESYKNEIKELLDDNVVGIDICRYYVDLVPFNVTPEVFWARYVCFIGHDSPYTFQIIHSLTYILIVLYRYFYRKQLLLKLYDTNTKHILADNNEEEDEEDETVWDEAVINTSTNTNNSTSTDSNAASAILIKTLKEENLNLRNNIKTLIKRVTELESVNSSTTTTSITTDPNLTLTPAKPSSLPPSQQQQQWGLSPFTPTTPLPLAPSTAPLPPTTTTTTSTLKTSKNTVVNEEVLLDYHSENSSDVSTTDIAALTGGKAVIINTHEVNSKLESSPSDKSITATTNNVSPKPEKSSKLTSGTTATAATDSSSTPLKAVYNEDEEEEDVNNWE